MDKEQLFKQIEIYLEGQKKEWPHLIYGVGDLYQSFNELGIKGKRNTEERIVEYELKTYLKETDSILDIGCNCGFIDLQIAKHVILTDGVEINPYLVKIANVVKDYLSNTNSFFHNSDFKNYNPDKKYNAVFSFAADEVADELSKLSFEDYIKKILSLSESESYLFFESQASDILYGTWDKKYEILKKYFEVIKEKKIHSTYPTNVPERVYLVLKRK